MSAPPRELRALQGGDGIHGVAEACRLLPWGRQASEEYLRDAGLVHAAEIAGKRREWVVWREVLEDLARRSGQRVLPPTMHQHYGTGRRVRLPQSRE